METILEQAEALTVTEIVAVSAAIGYLLLAIRQNIWCWLCAVVSTCCYVFLFFEARLYMESLLNLFYLGMAFYGWYAWAFGGEPGNGLQVTTYPLRLHGLALCAITALSVASGLVLARYSEAAYPYVDSLTTWSAIWTTFLVARKVLENWWYWFVIDFVSVVLYWNRGLELTALLFVAYLVMIPFGLISWTRSYRERGVT